MSIEDKLGHVVCTCTRVGCGKRALGHYYRSKPGIIIVPRGWRNEAEETPDGRRGFMPVCDAHPPN